MRRLIIVLTILAVLLPTGAFAQEIYGRVWVSPGHSAGGAKVTAVCEPQSPRSVNTDSWGKYRFTGIRNVSQCSLSVNYQNKVSNSVSVYMTQRTRANLELQTAGNRWLLIRR